jgi:2-polyprenyl-6-methoxyphenol hydroxylase-like FAD-dependent oxidoreductase
MMLGYLLARAGVAVMVLEKHRDFFRDFRGDTVHPSTLEVFSELGLLQDLLKVPHQRIISAGGFFGDYPFTAANFSHLPLRCGFIALMPQWDFLNFLAGRARQFPAFSLELEHEATDLLIEDGRVKGVAVRTPAGARTIRADLVIGCDGRHSTTRRCGGFEVVNTGVPIDVLWFRIGGEPNDAEQVLGRLNYGKALILINRGDYFQAGMIIRKGSFAQIKEDGLPNFRESIARIAPFLSDRVGELRDWDQVKLLTVEINHLRRWYRPGLLCIGDAAHAMSPAGGVGINYAIQDAIAAARILSDALRERRSTDNLLARVQRRREFPVRVIQVLQKQAHVGFARVFDNPGPLRPPWQMKVILRIPGIQHAMGRLIGMGIRPEHVRKPQPHRKAIQIAAIVGTALALVTVRHLLKRKHNRRRLYAAPSILPRMLD